MESNTSTITPEQASSSHPGRRIAIILAVCLTLLAAAYVGLCAYASQSSTLYPGLTVGGVEVGGLTQAEAIQTLLDHPPADTTTLSLTPVSTETAPLAEPETITLSFRDLGGVELEASEAIENAFQHCHGGSFFLHGWRWLLARFGTADLPAALLAPRLSEHAAQLAQTLSRPAAQPTFEVTEDAVKVTVPRDGWTVDAAQLETVLIQALSNGTWAAVDCPATPQTAEPPLTAQALAEQLSGEMRNAGYDSRTDSFTPEQAHAEFDSSSAQSLLDQAKPGEIVTIPAKTQLPTVFMDDLQATLFRDLLGECTTKVGGSKGRKTNVRLSAQALNGLVLNDKEVFSYNRAVGKRTPDKGYQTAPAYFNGQTVMEYGGGVCQTSSTLYLACLRADLKITERYAHRYIPGYVPAGMDATVSWGGPDYKFANNTGYPIRIETSYANSQLTVKIWGTNVDGSSVKMTNQWLSTTPYEVVYIEDPALAPGEEEVRVTPYTGHKYKTYRNRYDADGNLISSTYEATSNYKARNQEIARGPAAQPEPPVTPDPIPPLTPPDSLPEPVNPTPDPSAPDAPPEFLPIDPAA